jgi:hypothetical protein
MRIIAFLHPGSNTRAIFVDMLKGYTSAGCEVAIFDLAPHWNHLSEPCADRGERLAGFTRHVKGLLEEARPDLTMAMWANMLCLLVHRQGDDGRARSIFDDLEIPHMCYWLDAPQWAQGGTIRDLAGATNLFESPQLLHVVNSRTSAREMRDVMRFGRIEAMPYGIEPRPVFDANEPEFDIVTSVGHGDPAPCETALAQLERDDPDMNAIRVAAASRVASKIRSILSDSRVAILPAAVDRLVDSQLKDRTRPAIDRVRETAPALITDIRAYVLTTMALREIEAHERAFTISWLSRRFKVATFGKGDLSAWRSRATVLGELPYEGMNDAYRRGRVGLNIMRWQDDSGLNLKPFEITSARVACVSQARPGGEECFLPGQEIEFFTSPQHAAGIIGSLCSDAQRRTELAQRGMARTLGGHTWRDRAESMETLVARAAAA